MRLGGTNSHFAFQEILVLGGLDQSLLLPTAAVLIGFRSHSGLEIGLGPSLGATASDSSALPIGISVLYALAWNFSFSGVHIPVDIAVNPSPRDGLSRFTLMTGFNFF